MLLNKAIGPKKAVRNAIEDSVDDSLPISEGSSTSLSAVEETSPVLSPRETKNKPEETRETNNKPEETRGRSAESPGGILKHRVGNRQRPRTAGFERRKKAEYLPATTELIQQHGGHNAQTSSVESGLKVDNANSRSGGGGDAPQLNQRKSSEGGFVLGESKQLENVRNVARQRPRSASAGVSGMSARQRSKSGRVLPIAKPVSDRPSSAMIRMAQQKQQPPQEPELQPDGDMERAEQEEEKPVNEIDAECNKLVVSDTVTEESVPEESVTEQNATSRDVKTLEVSILISVVVHVSG